MNEDLSELFACSLTQFTSFCTVNNAMLFHRLHDGQEFATCDAIPFGL